MSLKTIKNENGVYVELPKDKIEFVSKEAEIIYDLSLENDFLQQENQKLKAKYNKALEILVDYQLPCEIDNFNIKDENIDYCSRNCSVDEKIFIECWNRYIEQQMKEVE